MSILKEVREKESSIEIEISPMLDMYGVLDHYIPGGVVDKDEMDKKSIIRTSWRKLSDFAEEVGDNLQAVQGKFRKKLLLDIATFGDDVSSFRSRYEDKRGWCGWWCGWWCVCGVCVCVVGGGTVSLLKSVLPGFSCMNMSDVCSMCNGSFLLGPCSPLFSPGTYKRGQPCKALIHGKP